MSSKLQLKLRLIASPEMGERGESNYIRFPRGVRDRLGVRIQSLVRVGAGDYQTELCVKRARKEDLRRLVRMLAGGRITEEEALYAGFVTRAVQQQVARHGNGGDPWLSAAKEPITIGGDPEFGLVDGTGILHMGMNVLADEEGAFGSDGPGAEIRPSATRDHLGLVGNIEKILKNPPPAAAMFNWIGGATYKDTNREYWFGGHVHLGRPQDLDEEQANDCYVGIARALDHLVALPFVRLDTPNPTIRRNGCKYGYGKAGTFDSGGPEASIRTHSNRFEYRVLSGLWLTHPDLARITLGVVKCVAESAYMRARDKGYDPNWTSAPPSRAGLAKSLRLSKTREVTALINKSEPTSVTIDHLKGWERRLRELDFYGDYEEEVEALISLTRYAPSEFLLDLKRTWLEGAPLAPQAPRQLQNRLEAVAGKG